MAMGNTHMSVGLAAASALMLYGYVEPGLLALGGAAIGSILPDTDKENSMINNELHIGKVGYVLLGLALIYYRQDVKTIAIAMVLMIIGFSKHRGITHSMLAIGGLYFLMGAVVEPAIRISIVIGYALHILVDLLTHHPVQLLWPFNESKALKLFRTRGLIEKGLNVAMLAIFIYNLYQMIERWGIMSLVRL